MMRESIYRIGWKIAVTLKYKASGISFPATSFNEKLKNEFVCLVRYVLELTGDKFRYTNILLAYMHF